MIAWLLNKFTDHSLTWRITIWSIPLFTTSVSFLFNLFYYLFDVFLEPKSLFQ